MAHSRPLLAVPLWILDHRFLKSSEEGASLSWVPQQGCQPFTIKYGGRRSGYMLNGWPVCRTRAVLCLSLYPPCPAPAQAHPKVCVSFSLTGNQAPTPFSLLAPPPQRAENDPHLGAALPRAQWPALGGAAGLSTAMVSLPVCRMRWSWATRRRHTRPCLWSLIPRGMGNYRAFLTKGSW